MTIIKTIALFVFSAFMFVGVAMSVSQAEGADEKTAMAAIADAKKAQKAASAVGGEWRDIGKFIKSAENAAKGGDFAKALKLAKKAKFQSDAGIAQAKLEAEVAKELPDYMN